MLCSLCQGVLTLDNTSADTMPSGKALPHHRTCATLKQSVEAGCYVCNRLWANLALDEQQIVSASCDSAPHEDNEGGLQANPSLMDESDVYITASSFSGGQPYGYSGCYLWELAFNASRVVVPDKTQDRVFWRASFLLQPYDSKTHPREFEVMN